MSAGEKPIPRYCPLEHPPDLCTRACGMGPCELATAAEKIEKAWQGQFSKQEIDGSLVQLQHALAKGLSKTDITIGLAQLQPGRPATHCGRCGDAVAQCGCSPEALSKFMADILAGRDVEDPLLEFQMSEYARQCCYACGDRLDYEPTSQPALCGDCDNLP